MTPLCAVAFPSFCALTAQLHVAKYGIDFFAVIAAFGAVNAIGTASQLLSAVGTRVVFSNVTTFVGVKPRYGMFSCLTTALYFVHYRLLAKRQDQSTSEACVISLSVGSNEIKVSSQPGAAVDMADSRCSKID